MVPVDPTGLAAVLYISRGADQKARKRLMHITMVKKRLSNGEPCRKCQQAEELLRSRGLWDQIDEFIWAVEDDPESEGMRLGAKHDVATAPFFIVRDGSGAETVYRAVLKLVKALKPKPTSQVIDRVLSPEQVQAAAAELSGRPAREVIRWALERWGADCAIAFSGAEDVALIHMAADTGLPFSVFTLDTGRLHAETYQFIQKVRERYRVDIRMMSPDPRDLEPFVRKKGLFSFYQDGHEECCGIRKVGPLKRALSEHVAWITGQRRDQSPATRGAIPIIQIDPTFSGRDDKLYKLNPLAEWSSKQTWEFLRDAEVPHNGLHEKGYISIGCEPCTRPTLPGEHERAGRWWWEDTTRRECGLHIGNTEHSDGEETR